MSLLSDLGTKVGAEFKSHRLRIEDLESKKFKKRYNGVANVDIDAYVNVAKISGDRLGSAIEMAVNGTSGNVVVNVVATIIVNHAGDVYIESKSGNYTQLDIQIVSDSNEDFDIRLKRTGYPGATPLEIDIYTFNDEIITFTSTATYSTTTHNHITHAGSTVSGSGTGSSLHVTGGKLNSEGLNTVNGGVAQFYTSSNNLRGYIAATETNDAHLTIATSGGEDIAFKDGGLSGSTNMIIRGEGSVSIPGYVEIGNGVDSVSNDGRWDGRLNIAGTNHAKIETKTNTDGIITAMYSHDGHGAGNIGTISDHPLDFMIGGSDIARLTSTDLTIDGSINIGGTIGSRDHTLSVIGDNNSCPIAIKVGDKQTVFGILPWSSGETYLSSGIYYDDGQWIHASTDNTNSLFRFGGNGGATWYASNDGTDSWNVTGNGPKTLWDETGTWVGEISNSNLGKINNVYFSKTSTELSTTSTSYQTVLSKTITMDTNKFNYLIDWHTPVKKPSDSTESTGVDLGILLNGTVISQAGHRLYAMNTNAYSNQSIKGYVTSGYVGSVNVVGAIASYNSGTVSTHDNHENSGSSLTIWEIRK